MILQGDVIAVLKTLPSDSVHCCITSPPYWGLRDYGVVGQIGMESTLAEHLQVMVDVFREVKRVLRKDGTLWLNYGDIYASAPNGRKAKDIVNDDRTFRDKPISTVGGRLKPKDRILLPARVAIALQEDGWWIRDEIIWHKPNPMPSSVRDRCTPAHEMIYMLTKSKKYFYDQEAIKTPAKRDCKSDKIKVPGGWDTSAGAHSTINKQGRTEAQYVDKQRGHSRVHAGFNDRWDKMDKQQQQSMAANKRSVWTVAPHPFKEAHFATFPPDLIEPCILAGVPEKCCWQCGMPFKRIVDKEFVPQEDVCEEKGVRGAGDQKPLDKSDGRQGFPRGTSHTTTTGWVSQCGHDMPPVAGTVLDPFFGAGTTGLVAMKKGRKYIAIELNSEYIKIAEKRLGLTLAAESFI